MGFIWRFENFIPEALLNSSGDYETAFFSSVYRSIYFTGVSTEEKGKSYVIYRFMVKLMIAMFLSSELWELFSTSASLDGVIENVSVTLIHIIAVYRYQSMVSNKAIYKQLAMSMESPYFDVSTPGRQKILEHWLKTNNKYFKFLLCYRTCTLSIWYAFNFASLVVGMLIYFFYRYIHPLLDDVDCNLVLKLYVPFYYCSPKRYFFTYAGVLLAFHYISYFVILNDLVLQAYLIHLLCQFSVLGDCFENILSDCSDSIEGLNNNHLHLDKRFTSKYTMRLKKLVEQHKLILRNALGIRQILSAPMLGQVVSSGMLICLAAYQVTFALKAGLPKFLMNLLYLAYNLFELFVFCLWCDEIKMQSEQIGLSVYRSGWERGMATLPGVRARLTLVMLRASRPVELTAGSFYDVSLKSYAMLVKTSYSALTVLLRTRRDYLI